MIFIRALARSGWLAGLFAACAVVALVLFVLSRTSVPPGNSAVVATGMPRPVVRFSKPGPPSESGAWGVHSAMNDLSPLFLPSDRNARLAGLPPREPGDGTLDAETPIFRFKESDAAILASLPAAITLNDKPLERATELDGLFADDSASHGSGFGRLPPSPIATFPRSGVIQVYASGSGQIVAVEELKSGTHPTWSQLWHPLEFLAAVDSTGLVSPLSLIVASRVDSVDAFFRDYLDRTFRVGERLAPGFYRIVVSP